MPGYFFSWAALAVVHAQLGDGRAAGEALQQLLVLKPDFAQSARAQFGRWFVSTHFVDHVVEGLRKAGLDVV